MSRLRIILALTILTGQLGLSARSIAGAATSDPDRSELAVRSEIVLDRYAPGIAVGSDSLWILQPKMLLRVDMDTGETKAQIPLECSSRLLTFSAGRVFAACESNRVFVIDPSTDEVTHTLRVKGMMSAITRGDDAVWILRPLGKIARVDPENLAEVDTLKIVGKGLSVNQDGLTYAHGRLWILNTKKGRLMGVDPNSGEVSDAPIDLGDGVIRIVAGPESLWIVNARENQVWSLDPGSRQITARIPVGDTPTDAVFFGNAIWVVNGGDRSLTRIEQGSHAVSVIPLPTSSRPISVLAGDGSLWLATIDDYRVLGMQQARLDEASSGAETGSPASPQCMTGPDYTREMLDRECDSVQAIQKSPPGRLAAVAEAGDHGWVFAGSADSPTPALFLLRTDIAGRVSWISRFGQSPEARGVDVVSLLGGEHVVAADIRHDKESSWETLLARVNAGGDLIWERRFPASGASRLVSQIATLPGGEVVMAGSLMSDAPSQYRQGFIAAIDSGGEVVWEAHLDEVEGIDRAAVSDSEIAAAGPPRGQSSLHFFRLDFTGEVLGSIRAASENIQATDLIPMADGGWTLVGDPGVWAGRGYLLRLGPSGETMWCRYLGSGDAYIWGWILLPFDDGSLLAAGTPRYHVSFVGPRGFLNLARISTDGELVEEQLFKGFASRQVLGLFAWRDTGYVLFSAGNWGGPIGQKLVRVYERPKRRYSGDLRKSRRILLDLQGRVPKEQP